MKHTLLILLFASLLPLSAAQVPSSPADPFAGAFFSPELITLARDQIAMTQIQQDAFRNLMGKSQPRFEELRKMMERETAMLATLAKQKRVDEAAIIAQLDKVLDAERESKHLRLRLLVGIKNLLTPEQQTKLYEIAKGGGTQPSEATRERLTKKVENVQAGAQAWIESGRDPSAIAQAMEEKVKPLFDAGKVIEAEAELDRVLELLKQKQK